MRIGIQTLAGMALLLGSMTLSSSAMAQMPEEIAPGTRIEMEGRIFDMNTNTLVAMEIAVLRAPTGEDGIKGIVQQIDHAKKTMTIAGVSVDCSGDCFVAGSDGRPLAYEKIEQGQRAKAKGAFENGVFKGDFIQVKEMKPGASAAADVEGRIASVDRAGNSFEVHGVVIQVTPKTIIEME